MDEQQFLKTMIETVKYDDYNYKDELLGILRNSIIKYKPTGSWSAEPGKYKEHIVLRVPIPMLKQARKLEKELESLAEDVYVENSLYAFGDLMVKPKAIELDSEEFREHDVIFDEIKNTIIQGIRNAKYTIWAAVAWFTDDDIFEELMLRKQVGVNIRLITSDEESNKYLIKNIEENFEIVKIPLKGRYLSNRLHDKFCIIDFEFVMHGSYNWSKNARNNDETLATALDRDFVRKFSDEFMRLYNENK
ncbi:MAG: phospholipase D-like domain-containing protein [Clostridium sp.]|uniref:phospholipase D-like domain-containing protein n=1 Tax=Clostridium sp. TaxID=1506 RepID=UPI0028FED687|nr:phospholipase D-like domain-containing protein [Clostridium sp.]MDU2895240.1 phospholipase D-like domain-containing protein [Clostridium sp.]MDU3007049.1 phospholipase D-like domain-containing protein [Clostridium sp.]MDU3036961.1 phospholipase D-like domain-containing protein [Clostridium sp.]MDU3051284.1 phospholipase D-like domain-containing protein [Clostridium sp.]